MNPDTMLPVVQLRIAASDPDKFPDETRLVACLTDAIAAMFEASGIYKGHGRTEISISIVGDDEIRRLNQDHRGQNRPTDVLSFPLNTKLEKITVFSPDDPPRMLGDVVISDETIERQAEERGVPFAERFCEAFIHGILHLIGMEHESVEGRASMERMEDELSGITCHRFSEIFDQ